MAYVTILSLANFSKVRFVYTIQSIKTVHYIKSGVRNTNHAKNLLRVSHSLMRLSQKFLEKYIFDEFVFSHTYKVFHTGLVIQSLMAFYIFIPISDHNNRV